MSDKVATEAAKIRASQNATELLLTGKDRSIGGIAGAALIMRGLMDYRYKWMVFGEKRLVPTRFGRKVRNHLKGESNA
jgi:reverse gyrase